MTQAQHTPGPWALSRPKYSCDRERVKNSEGIQVADVHSHIEDDLVGNANARLIAAAPELLEALEGAIGALEFSVDFARDDEGEDNSEDIEFAQNKLKAAILAIANARGQS